MQGKIYIILLVDLVVRIAKSVGNADDWVGNALWYKATERVREKTGKVPEVVKLNASFETGIAQLYLRKGSDYMCRPVL
jgi:hypothetical protein